MFSFVILYNTLAYRMMDCIGTRHLSAGTEDDAVVRRGLNQNPKDAI